MPTSKQKRTHSCKCSEGCISVAYVEFFGQGVLVFDKFKKICSVLVALEVIIAILCEIWVNLISTNFHCILSKESIKLSSSIWMWFSMEPAFNKIKIVMKNENMSFQK